MRDAVFTFEGNDYDDESRSDESTKIFDEVPRETGHHHILLLNIKIFDEVSRGTRRHVYFLFKKIFFNDISRRTQSLILIQLLN